MVRYMRRLQTAGQETITAWREHWPYFKLALAMFIVGTILGVILADRIDLFALLGLEDLGDVLPDEITAVTILLNNSLVFVLAIVGVLSFGLLTVVILLFNGFLVGYVTTPVAFEFGLDVVLVAILPHAIFELPAFFVAAAIAFRLLHRFVHRISGRRERILDPGEGTRIVLLAVAAWIVLAIAAVIEVYVTFWLLETLYPEFLTNGS